MSLQVAGDGRSAYENAGAIVIAGLGLVLGLVGIEAVLSNPEPLAWWSFEFGIAAALPAGLMYAGYWLARTDFEADELWGVTAWSFAGVVTLTTAGGWLFLHQTAEGSRVSEPGFLLVTLATVGALGGLACGVASAGSIGGGFGARAPDAAEPATGESRPSEPSADAGAGRDDGSSSGEWVGLASVPADERDADDVDLEEVVAGEQRRIAVAYLVSTPGRALTVHQLVDLIVERKLETTGDRPDREPVLRRLHCIDLPRLAAAGLIERDEHGLIRYVGDDEETDRLLTLVEAIESFDDS